jgi:hypothetical protein
VTSNRSDAASRANTAEPGAVDVIDTLELQRVKSIPVKGAVHNTYVPPDGRYVVAGSIQGKNATIIDAQTEQPLWVLDFELGVRPMAFETNPDGSTKRMFVQLTEFNGFAVVDFAMHKEVTRIELPKLAPGRSRSSKEATPPTEWQSARMDRGSSSTVV